LKGSDPYILHDMPIHPGYEIDAELVNSPKSLIYEQAANRTFVQQALMLHLLGIAAE
jgi:ornithine carbamoyltransferase